MDGFLDCFIYVELFFTDSFCFFLFFCIILFFFSQTGHWNPTVKQLTNSVIKMYSKADVKLYDSILAEHMSSQREKERKRVKNDARWEKLPKN